MKVNKDGLVTTSELENKLSVVIYWMLKKSKLHYKTLVKIRKQLY